MRKTSQDCDIPLNKVVNDDGLKAECSFVSITKIPIFFKYNIQIVVRKIRSIIFKGM